MSIFYFLRSDLTIRTTCFSACVALSLYNPSGVFYKIWRDEKMPLLLFFGHQAWALPTFKS